MKNLAAVHVCKIKDGTPCDYSFTKTLSVSCFATAKTSPILDQVNCVFRNPKASVEDFVKVAKSATSDTLTKLAEKPGFVTGAGTYTTKDAGALTVGYIEKKGAATLMAACLLLPDSK
ncbi:hypothetical protein RFN25_18095 [Mesorhizobium abyssinicae]|uniref:hypothetical protein n=1 Tax=Mesorhizobium abyssinicae TaxID=1209958 RepID=UPI002A23A495|nr:hypothetical protein [Mesorhizobium abyssinicae]MDX8435337.1 hypothetical protein [Mesorhizobium abyssinicae]